MGNSKAEDPQFSQFYSIPMYLNPAFTGNTIQMRFGANYRKQWAGIPGAFTTYSIAFDHFISKYNSGVGLMVMHDKAGSGGLRFTNIGGLYSFKMALTRKLFLSTGVRASYVSRALNLSDLTFYDQYVREDPNSSVETLVKSQVSYFDLTAGAILYSQQFWFGVAFDHLTTPNQSLIGISSKLPIKYSAHAGVKVPVDKDAKGNSDGIVTIAANYKAQQDWDQLDIGAFLNYQTFVIGLWYRGIPALKAYKPGYSNNDAIILSAGYMIQDFLSLGYSYDITISKLGVGSRGAHELSIIYEYAQPDYKRDARRKKFMVPCAKFTKMPYAIRPTEKKRRKK